MLSKLKIVNYFTPKNGLPALLLAEELTIHFKLVTFILEDVEVRTTCRVTKDWEKSPKFGKK
jgi:hypothetical protein